MKAKRLLFCIILTILCAGCGFGKPSNFLYGRYVDLLPDTFDAVYQRNYLIMDCCEEWEDLCIFLNHTEGLSMAEGFEFYMYDEDEQNVEPKKEILILYRLSEEFRNRYDGSEISVISFPDGKVIPAAVGEGNGCITFRTDHCGIYVAVCYGSKELWISNIEDCTGQCRTCSDEW